MRYRLICASIVTVAAIASSAAWLGRDGVDARADAVRPRAIAPGARAGAEHSSELPAMPTELRLKQIYTLNQSAFVPPQCYTKTLDASGRAHNPCYTCHVSSRAPNYIDDPDVQLEYAFVPRARKNAWSNLFVDWAAKSAGISDVEILSYVRTSNYFDRDQNIVLAKKLASAPLEWDHGSDGKWSGFVPDAHFRFDSEGFDRTPADGYTGWRAFAYHPVPGTFWPTNGSFGDVLIRLPPQFRKRESGEHDLTVYKVNLAVVEALITRRSVGIQRADEVSLGVDLDRDGSLGAATAVAFSPSVEGAAGMSFVGQARAALASGSIHLAVGLYPEGTEFLHSLRYLDPSASGVAMAPRMKELRYAKKREWWSYRQLEKRAKVEAIAKVDSPAELRNFGGDIEQGVDNNQGWSFQGFIEDARGELRPQSFEETVYCVGCHGGVGATDDSIFSFSRRLGRDAFQQGFYHWSQRGLEGVPDRPLGDGATEYVTYLEQNGAGDEYRSNSEILARFFDAKGRLEPAAKARLRRDVSQLLIPSRERALALNKAYLALVREQSFRLGRDIVLGGAHNVERQVSPGQKTGIVAAVERTWSESPLPVARNE